MNLPMKGILRQHDLVYECAPMAWIDGIPIANGNMGAVVWGDGRPLRFTLDSYDVWETRTLWPGDDSRFTYANLRRLKEEGRIEELREIALRRRNTRFEEAPPPHPTRLALGRMEVKWSLPCSGFEARLDLLRARVSGTVRIAGGKAVFSSFMCSTRDVLVLEIRTTGDVPLPEIALSPAPVDEFSRKHFRAWKYPAPELVETGGQRVLFRRYGENKEYAIVADSKRSKGVLRVFLTIAAGAEGDHTREQALDRIAEARRTGIKALREEHEADWAKFWEKSAIQLPDSRLENLYYVELYKHYCSSRPGSLPVPIQGLWTTDGAWPPWRGNYTTDMNIQESYWAVYTANHLDSARPVYDMYWGNLPYHRRMGQYWYGKPHAIITGEHGPGGEPFPGFVTDEHCPSAGAWIAHLFWLHWLYSRDKRFLRERAYPFLREMVQGYLHIIEKRDDGKYHIPFCDSPEFFCGQPETLGDDTNYDLGLLRFLLESLLASQRHLGRRDRDCSRWREVLDGLLEYPVAPSSLFQYECTALSPKEPRPDPRGHMCLAMRAGEALPQTHRHHSHLIGIYPLGVIDPERSEAERRLVDNCLEDLVFKGTGEWGGFSFPWASLLAGRAGKVRMAHHFLRLYLEGLIRPNTFDTNNSDPTDPSGACARQGLAMTLETGFAAAAASVEMLLQSQHDLIRVFPTSHPAWGDAAFFRLRAEGAFIVSARMGNHEVVFVEIESEAGGRCRVRNPFGGEGVLRDLSARASRGKARAVRRMKGEVFEFATKRGGRYLLAAEGSRVLAGERQPAPVRRPRRAVNWFGLKRHPRF